MKSEQGSKDATSIIQIINRLSTEDHARERRIPRLLTGTANTARVPGREIRLVSVRKDNKPNAMSAVTVKTSQTPNLEDVLKPI